MQPTNELKTERHQRRTSERLNVWQAVILALLVIVVAALTGWADEGRSLRKAGLCDEASRVESRVRDAPAPTAAPTP